MALPIISHRRPSHDLSSFVKFLSMRLLFLFPLLNPSLSFVSMNPYFSIPFVCVSLFVLTVQFIWLFKFPFLNYLIGIDLFVNINIHLFHSFFSSAQS